MTESVGKIRNKERCAWRGKKQRYSVWRNELNLKWERCYEQMVVKICNENNLCIWDFYIEHKTRTWTKTFENIFYTHGHRFLSIQNRRAVGDVNSIK